MSGFSNRAGLAGWAATALGCALVALAGIAQAHEGHAGPMIEFLGTKEALRQVLPEGATVVVRKEPLDETARAWAEQAFALSLPAGVQTYYLARDRATGATAGAALITEIDHRHGAIRLAVGVDAQGRVTRAGIVGVHQKYLGDVEGEVGRGLLPAYAGRPVDALVPGLSGSDSALGGRVEAALREAAVLLLALMRPAED